MTDRRAAFVLASALFLSGGGPAPAAADAGPAGDFAGPIEAAQSREAWASHEAIQSNLRVSFGGKTILAGRMIFRTDFSGSRLELKSGTVAVFDGSRAWVSPSSAPLQQARFHLLTWPYFLSAPMKLRDPGTRLESLGTKSLRGESYDAARLTFAEGVGDAPDDWYILYRDPESGLLRAMAYVVTYGGSLKEAEKEPHAITYEEFVEVDGVRLATVWKFWRWSPENGISGEPIGEASLQEIRFVTPSPEAFARPEDSRPDELPGSS